ncbi:MAG: cation diffusion facilitator family transporter [Paludibacter sp.]|jgi:cation diffusion facilitator family transporter
MNNNKAKKVHKVTWIGLVVNVLLTAFKILAGFLGRSSAILADGIHSLSDFITDVLVLVFVGISVKDKDDDHRYGHGKFETFATLLISIALLAVGVFIFTSGVSKIMQVIKGEVLEQPTYLALVAALVSILLKEILYRYTKRVGEEVNSSAVIANAWHHRSDAFSSIGTSLGIAGAMFLGEPWRILDPIAAVVVSFFIVKVAIELGIPCMHELLERSLPEEIEKIIIDLIESHPDVIFQHNLKTRKIGNIYAIDVHIKLDKNISFVKSHDVATEIEVRLRDKFGPRTITNIHTEPFEVKEKE